MVGGLGIGLSQVFLGLIPEGSLFWALAVVKTAAGLFLVVVILVRAAGVARAAAGRARGGRRRRARHHG